MNTTIKHVSTTAAAVAALALTCAPAHAAKPRVPGNNGTVKIAAHGDMDRIPNNTPHPGCLFDVQWYGYDQGSDIVSHVSFAPMAPTKSPGMTVSGPSDVFVGGDPATGAGTPTGWDGQATYRLSFTGAPAHQGYHVKLTVTTPDSKGNDTKTKVFWVQNCGTTAPAGPVKSTGHHGGGHFAGGHHGAGTTSGGGSTSGGGTTSADTTPGGTTSTGSTPGGQVSGTSTSTSPSTTSGHPAVVGQVKGIHTVQPRGRVAARQAVRPNAQVPTSIEAGRAGAAGSPTPFDPTMPLVLIGAGAIAVGAGAALRRRTA